MLDDVGIGSLALYLFFCSVAVESAYQKVKLIGRKPDEDEPLNWRHEVFPVVFGALVVLAFWPTSVFSFVPFHPAHPAIDVLLSALIVSRGANLNHTAYDSVGQFVANLIGRITPKF